MTVEHINDIPLDSAAVESKSEKTSRKVSTRKRKVSLEEYTSNKEKRKTRTNRTRKQTNTLAQPSALVIPSEKKKTSRTRRASKSVVSKSPSQAKEESTVDILVETINNFHSLSEYGYEQESTMVSEEKPLLAKQSGSSNPKNNKPALAKRGRRKKVSIDFGEDNALQNFDTQDAQENNLKILSVTTRHHEQEKLKDFRHAKTALELNAQSQIDIFDSFLSYDFPQEEQYSELKNEKDLDIAHEFSGGIVDNFFALAAETLLKSDSYTIDNDTLNKEPKFEEHSLINEENEKSPEGKNRPSRRGGRGKRGKKRALTTPSLAEQKNDDVLDDFESKISIDEDVSQLQIVTDQDIIDKPTPRGLGTKKVDSTNVRKMFISMVQGEQVEVALVEAGVIHEYYLEMLHQVKTKGNIYKGIVNNIDVNLQAAFISYGTNKNGFLQIDEIHPEYYQAHLEDLKGKKFPPIQKIIKPGQEILVQVVKEPTGNKGAFLTTWLSLPGRFLVLTPGQEQIGVSRKVDSDEERTRLRNLMTGIDPGAGLGVIVRTASAGTTKTTLKSDLQYLKRVWREIRKRGLNEDAPALLYRESGLAERAIRDYLTDDVVEVWVDSIQIADSLRETLALLFPRKKELVRMHADVRQTLWERFNMQRQLEQIYSREVLLPSGGRLVFDQTEALMAIDINSGKISGKGNFESMALKTNLEAAEAIARHLKLRDIGGQIVIDFIDMRDKNHVREVEKTLRNAMKNDRARHDVARMSSFGLLEIVRQRTGSSALAISMEPCPHCKGTGARRNLEWQALQALCEMERKARSAQGGKYTYETSFTELALYLLNHKRQRIAELEEQLKVRIEVRMR